MYFSFYALTLVLLTSTSNAEDKFNLASRSQTGAGLNTSLHNSNTQKHKQKNRKFFYNPFKYFRMFQTDQSDLHKSSLNSHSNNESFNYKQRKPENIAKSPPNSDRHLIGSNETFQTHHYSGSDLLQATNAAKEYTASMQKYENDSTFKNRPSVAYKSRTHSYHSELDSGKQKLASLRSESEKAKEPKLKSKTSYYYTKVDPLNNEIYKDYLKHRPTLQGQPEQPKGGAGEEFKIVYPDQGKLAKYEGWSQADGDVLRPFDDFKRKPAKLDLNPNWDRIVGQLSKNDFSNSSREIKSDDPIIFNNNVNKLKLNRESVNYHADTYDTSDDSKGKDPDSGHINNNLSNDSAPSAPSDASIPASNKRQASEPSPSDSDLKPTNYNDKVRTDKLNRAEDEDVIRHNFIPDNSRQLLNSYNSRVDPASPHINNSTYNSEPNLNPDIYSNLGVADRDPTRNGTDNGTDNLQSNDKPVRPSVQADFGESPSTRQNATQELSRLNGNTTKLNPNDVAPDTYNRNNGTTNLQNKNINAAQSYPSSPQVTPIAINPINHMGQLGKEQSEPSNPASLGTIPQPAAAQLDSESTSGKPLSSPLSNNASSQADNSQNQNLKPFRIDKSEYSKPAVAVSIFCKVKDVQSCKQPRLVSVNDSKLVVYEVDTDNESNKNKPLLSIDELVKSADLDKLLASKQLRTTLDKRLSYFQNLCWDPLSHAKSKVFEEKYPVFCRKAEFSQWFDDMYMAEPFRLSVSKFNFNPRQCIYLFHDILDRTQVFDPWLLCISESNDLLLDKLLFHLNLNQYVYLNKNYYNGYGFDALVVDKSDGTIKKIHKSIKILTAANKHSLKFADPSEFVEELDENKNKESISSRAGREEKDSAADNYSSLDMNNILETKLYYKETNKSTLLMFKTTKFLYSSFSVNVDSAVVEANPEYQTLLPYSFFQNTRQFAKFNVLLLNYMLRRARLSQVASALANFRDRLVSLDADSLLGAEALNLALRFINLSKLNYHKWHLRYREEPDSSLLGNLKIKYFKDVRFIINHICDYGVICKKFMLSNLARHLLLPPLAQAGVDYANDHTFKYYFDPEKVFKPNKICLKNYKIVESEKWNKTYLDLLSKCIGSKCSSTGDNKDKVENDLDVSSLLEMHDNLIIVEIENQVNDGSRTLRDSSCKVDVVDSYTFSLLNIPAHVHEQIRTENLRILNEHEEFNIFDKFDKLESMRTIGIPSQPLQPSGSVPQPQLDVGKLKQEILAEYKTDMDAKTLQLTSLFQSEIKKRDEQITQLKNVVGFVLDAQQQNHNNEQ